MKTILSIATIHVLLVFSLGAETLWGPGTIQIATNEAILINTVYDGDFGFVLYCDGFEIPHNTDFEENPRFAVAGPHLIAISNANSFMTFQRLQGSSIQTVLLQSGTTNTIDVLTNKTIHFFSPIGNTVANVYPLQSSNVYKLFGGGFVTIPHPSLTGPAEIRASAGVSASRTIISYYVTDEVMQFPPTGLLLSPGQQLEVNIEKSHDLTNWVPTGVFNTEAENGAFYRLRILK